MTLERVSFKKGREHQPRISKPYIPGVRSDRYWTDEECQILRDHYPDKGFAFCASKLPNRNKSSIYAQANKLGLHRNGIKQQRKKHTRDELADLDQKILEIYQNMTLPPGSTSGAKEIGRQVGKDHWLISQRLKIMGLTRSRTKEPNWTAAEEELMKNVPLHDPDKCAEIFRAHGFSRTPTAIMVKSKRLNLSRRYTESYSATSAAKIVGLDNKTVSEYCLKGIIKAGRRKTKRLTQQGGDWHSIERADLRQFVIDNLEMLDFRKVDKFAIVDLLINEKSGAA